MKYIFLIFFSASSFLGLSQVVVDNTLTVEWYIQNVLAGTGITITNVQFNAGSGAVVNPQVGQFTDATSSIGVSNGLILGSGDVNMAAQQNTSTSSTLGGGTGPGVDADLASITPNQINDECVVEFDFVPVGDSIIFSYVFASEEYEEYVCASVNDAFGFFLTGNNPSGPNYVASNLALIPDPTNPSIYTTTPVSINTVNPGVAGSNGVATNCSGIDANWASYNVFYAGANTTVPANYEYDGNTVVLFCKAAVNCGETYHIKLAIGDAGDGSFDSGVFLEGGSFSSPLPVVNILPLDENGDVIEDGQLPEGCIEASLLLIKPIGYTDSTFVMDLDITGTATNGTDYTQINGTYTILPGDDTLSLTIEAFLDALTEGTETLIISTYFIAPCGDTIDVTDTLYILDVAANYNLTYDDITLDCPLDSVNIMVTPDGGIPNIDYDWTTTGDTLASIWVPANTVGTITYPVTATDFCGITSTANVTVTVNNSTPPTIVFIDDDILTCVGQNGVLLQVDSIANAADPSAITYTWSPVVSNTNSVTVFPTANSTYYYLTVFDGCNTVTDSVHVQVEEAVIQSITIVDALGCAGQGAILGSITVLPANPNWTFTLVGNAQTYGPSNNNIFNNLTGNLSYTLTAVDENGCIADSNVFVGEGTTGVSATFVDASLQNVSCFGANDGEAEISNIIGGVNTPQGPYNVIWSNAATSTQFTTNNLNVGAGDMVNNLFGGSWQVLVTEQTSGCAWSHLFEIIESNALQTSTNPNEPICFGTATGSITVGATGGTQPYTFTIKDDQGVVKNSPGTNTANSLVTGTYTYTVVDANGCSGNGSVFLDQPGALDIAYTTQDISCYGRNTGSIEILDVFNFTGNEDLIEHRWDPDVSGTGVSPFNDTARYNLPPDEYVITVTDENGCTNAFTVFVKDTVPIVLSLDSEPAYCRTKSFQKGNGVVFGDASGGGGVFVFEWKNIETGATVSNTTWGGLNPGSYQFTATDQSSCRVSDIIVLDSVTPIAAFTLTSDGFDPVKAAEGICEGTEMLSVKFKNESQYFSNTNNPLSDTTFSVNYDYAGGGGYDKWFFSYDYNENLDTTYEGREDPLPAYNYCLVAINFNGCTDTLCKDIRVFDFPVLTVPNVFTPGTSPPNNEFYFPNVGIVEFKCTIFDRYGVPVFVYDTINDKWNGNNFRNDRPCSDGTYFYNYDAKSSNGTVFKDQGSVTLIRDK